MDPMRRLNIGIYFNARRDQGGLYQYAVTLIHCLNQHGSKHRYTLFHATLEPLPAELDNTDWRVISLPRSSLLPRFGIELALMYLARLGWRYPIKVLPPHRQFQQENIDLMLYIKPTIHTFLWSYPFVFPIHDLQHLLQPEFPEVTAGGEWSRREFMYRNAVPKAEGIITDSEVGREDVVNLYNADPACVFPLPYLAPTYLSMGINDADLSRVRERYQLPENFLFYPASFWPHKNHMSLVRALKVLERNHNCHDVHMVFAGGCRHECEKLKVLSEELGLTDIVHFLGYVPDEDIYPLYRLAFALVMPTFFGPTNIPFLEAWAHDCPVITSNIRGIREQVEDSGLLANPRDEAEIAGAIYRLLQDSNLRDQLIKRGRKKYADWTPSDFAARLESILEQCLV